jgi:hypothetical protein
MKKKIIALMFCIFFSSIFATTYAAVNCSDVKMGQFPNQKVMTGAGLDNCNRFCREATPRCMKYLPQSTCSACELSCHDSCKQYNKK